jgi:hypothetical protein
MYNISQQQQLISLASHHHHHLNHNSASTSGTSDLHINKFNLSDTKLDKILSPKRKKRKLNNISPTTSSNSNVANLYDHSYKAITGDSFLTTTTGNFLTPKASNIFSQSSSGSNNNKNNNNRTVNLVDRVIDISKYTQNTTLYTMCKDWTNASGTINQKTQSSPIKKDILDSTTASTANSNTMITKLPDPVALNHLDEDFNEFNVSIGELNDNIKVNIRSSEESDLDLIKQLHVDDINLETHALLKLHVNRWKLVKREWFNYYNLQSKPYQNSYETLKSIFEDML